MKKKEEKTKVRQSALWLIWKSYWFSVVRYALVLFDARKSSCGAAVARLLSALQSSLVSYDQNPEICIFQVPPIQKCHFLKVFLRASTTRPNQKWLIFELKLSFLDTKLWPFTDFNYLDYFLSYRVNTQLRRQRRRHTNGKVSQNRVFYAFHDFLWRSRLFLRKKFSGPIPILSLNTVCTEK